MNSLARIARSHAPHRVLACVLVLILTIHSDSSARADDPPAFSSEQITFFENNVRPVLVDACIKCHGEKKQSGGLRLDSRNALLEGGENGPAIVPGDVEKSLLMQVVRQTHEDIKMPPKGKLPAEKLEVLAAWVKTGAAWPTDTPKSPGDAIAEAAANHWSFRPVKPAALPEVRDPAWVRSPVDAFILAQLDQAGLEPSEVADKHTLIRRLSFDLTGLPPTAAEVEAFVNDKADDAYDRLVERLLASPRYGERWARHWLDVARYADTKGYVFQEERRYPYAYTYRDYVIRAFNDDKPYDQFIVEQIAADRLDRLGDPRDLAALGFLTVGRRFLNVREDIIDDRIDVVCRGLMGLTVSCARCHDHKYDPVPMEDYYSLFGVFASSVEPADLPEIPASVPSDLARDFQAKVAEKQKAVDAYISARRSEIENDLRSHLGGYLKAAHDLGYDGRSAKLDERARADKLTSSRLRGFMMRWKAYFDTTRNGANPVFAPWHAFAALPEGEFSRKAPGIAKSFDEDNPKLCNPVVARGFSDQPPGSMAEVVATYARIFDDVEKQAEAARKAGKPTLDDPAWEAIRLALHGDAGLLTIPADVFPRMLDRAERTKLSNLNNAVAAIRASHPGSPPRAMVMNDAPRPFDPHVFLRGNPGRPGKAVPRRFLSLLAGPKREPFTRGSGRLEMAQAIASRDNPMTARVMVNRVWLHHFGVGLVNSPSDFGMRSDPPTHPELLDWLADDFMRSGWSIKALHRRIVRSNTYRQRSEARSEALAKDPENRLYWRFNRQRLEFEALRDALLAACGTLDTTMGGKGVEIVEAPYPTRRTIYGAIDRQNLDGVYRAFDFASPDSSSPRRFITTVPQQALFLMNNPFVIAQAKHLAHLPELTSGTPEERVRQVYLRLFGREPLPHERDLGVRFVAAQEQAGPSLRPIWLHGYGRFDDTTNRVAAFERFPHWTGSAWQFSASLPDPNGGYLNWNAGGGHVGRDQAHAAILRWVAPADTVVAVEGTLGHSGKQGDGVRGRIVGSNPGLLGTWTVHGQNVATTVKQVAVKAGDTIDFVVDCRENDGFDTFSWAPVVRDLGPMAEQWDARAGFQGPGDSGLSPWEEYAQVLLLTNEFTFVD